ncbi:MAG: radical SAM protein [Lachnospiraceae bacterium]|nr:radical SAM protein [Lachnospiraceae bacterium]
MRLYDLQSPAEVRLAQKADAMRLPLGGTMELLPLCNMDCKMCFIRQNPEEMKRHGRMLSCDEWLRIAREAKEVGVLFLLLTGGEPLIYPEFKRLYMELFDMGFILTINTNGTLIDEDWADFFAQRPCRRLNITLYGDSDQSYDRLCHNPKGHTQLLRALDLLGDRKIPYRLNYTITPDNAKQIEYACSFAKERGVALETAAYLFPPLRRGNAGFDRLSSAQAAQAKIDWIKHFYGEQQLQVEARQKMAFMNQPFYSTGTHKLTCRAGRSGFWIDWNGDLLPCGMFLNPKISLLSNSFGDGWEYIVKETAKLRIYEGCDTCKKRHGCIACGASCLAESGDMTMRPDYICEMTEEYYRLLLQYADKTV